MLGTLKARAIVLLVPTLLGIGMSIGAAVTTALHERREVRDLTATLDRWVEQERLGFSVELEALAEREAESSQTRARLDQIRRDLRAIASDCVISVHAVRLLNRASGAPDPAAVPAHGSPDLLPPAGLAGGDAHDGGSAG